MAATAAAAAKTAEPEQKDYRKLKPKHRRVQTPTILQMEAVECGAAALAIVLGYYNKIVPLEELRIECGVSRDGSKANNVLKAAKKYALDAKGYKKELEQLFEIKYPAILFWNANHFVVLEGFKGGKCYLSDPGMGPRIVTMEELDSSYSGVVLEFEKGPDFKPGGEKRSMLAALRRRLVGSELAWLFVLLCGLFMVVPGMVVPTFSRIFVDEFLIAQREYIVRPLLMGMAITAVITIVLMWLQEYYLLRLETKLALQSSSRFFQHILRLPVNYFAQRFAGEIGSRVMINDKVARVIAGKLATTTIDMAMIVFYAALMFRYNVILTFVVIFLGLLNVAAVKMVARSRIDASRRLMQDMGKMMGTGMSGLAMIDTLKATGGETEFFQRWAGYQAKTLRAEQALQLRSDLVNIVPKFVGTMITASVLLLGGLLVMDGQLTVGLLVAYQSLVGFFVTPLNSFVSFGSMLQELEADMNRLDDVLRYPQDKLYSREVKPTPELERKIKLDGYVELREVTFGYSPLDKPLIENFSLAIKPGQRVAFVGGSGSGKSTVAKLVTGLYEPWNGEILFDHVNKNELPRKLLSNSMGMVDQEIFLFTGTIQENVTMWDRTIPMPRVTQACRDAAIAEVIETRDGGYQAVVGEGGGNFSGGQRQRLEIARAFVGEPTILIFDEATSALDPATEEKVDDALRRRGCTCIIIAHRLSTVRECDEIIVMERGKIVQRGTHDEMIHDEDGAYAKLMGGH
ncbi:MAG TPA: NHLP family bacteriocin export ABC transporter peptidase/permease/ATPase subunit [Thermoanaerobaculia bacterium]|nr:NHLP family bacteriocin export ABC transporter peptidase/permease/ATPase subunit [Thermoanaerobaculia bacterium]